MDSCAAMDFSLLVSLFLPGVSVAMETMMQLHGTLGSVVQGSTALGGCMELQISTHTNPCKLGMRKKVFPGMQIWNGVLTETRVVHICVLGVLRSKSERACKDRNAGTELVRTRVLRLRLQEPECWD